MTTKKHVAIYVRVSTDQQKHRSQEPDLKRWAEDQELPVVFYRDKQSGKTMNRPGWKQLEAAMRSGKVKQLVCWKLDRLGRTARELLVLFDELRARKIDLICVAGGIMGLETPEGRLMAGIVAMFAEYDNEVRSERVRAGQAEARRNGVTWGGSQPGVRKKVKPEHVKAVQSLSKEGVKIAAIARTVKLSRNTIYDILRTA